MTHAGIDANLLSAYVSIAAFLLGVVALIREMRHTTLVRQVDLMLKYQEIFDGERMTKKRISACMFLQAKRPFDTVDSEWDKVSPVLDFFQDLALRTRTRGLPVDFVHGDYFYWFAHYWTACRGYIAHYQKASPMYLSDAVWLFEKCQKLDIKSNDGAYSNLSREEVDGFLSFELTTLIDDDA